MTWFGYLCDRYDAWNTFLFGYIIIFGICGWFAHLMLLPEDEKPMLNKVRPYLWFFHITSFIATILLLLLPTKQFICGG